MAKRQDHQLMRTTWYDDDGTQLVVTCADGSCLAELTTSRIHGDLVDVEILLQPRDESGLPRGPQVMVHREHLQLVPRLNATQMSGRFWLPDGLSPQTTRECFYRLRIPKNNCNEHGDGTN